MRGHLCRGKYKESVRPILLNSWEAFYFDFTGDDLVKLAEQAADLESRCLSWTMAGFGNRDSELRGLATGR